MGTPRNDIAERWEGYDSDRGGGGEDTVEALVMERLEDCLWGNVWAHGVDVYVGRIREIVCADV